MEPIGIPLICLGVALGCLAVTVRLWRDHQAITGKSLARSLQAKSDLALEEADARHQSLRREFHVLANEVGDVLEQASRKSQRAIMRDRRARERDEAAELSDVVKKPDATWADIKAARIRSAGI